MSNMCEKRSDGGFGLGLVLGALIGSFLGVLYAPEEGTKTRAKAKKFIDDNKHKGAALFEEVSSRVEEAKVKAMPVIQEIRDKMEPLMERIDSLSEPAREEVADFVEDLKEEITEGLGGGVKDTKSEDGFGSDNMKKRFFKGVKRS